MTIRHPDRPVPWSADGLVTFAATTVDVVAAPEDGPRLLSQAARRLCDAAGPGAVLAGAGGELTADLGAGLRAGMFVSTEMRRDTGKTSLLRLHLRLSGEGEPPPAASLERWAGIWHRQALSTVEVKRLAGELPLMEATVERLRLGRPLADLAVLVTGHFLTDLVRLVHCLGELGAPLEAMTVLRKDYAYRWRHRVHGHLLEQGVHVADCTDGDAVAAHTARARRAGLACLALDDGGYVAPALLDGTRARSSGWSGSSARAGSSERAAGVSERAAGVSERAGVDEAAWSPVRAGVRERAWSGERPPPGGWAGVVEQTMSGIYRLQGREAELPFPVFSVAQSRLKGRIESYWIAEKAVTTALELLPALKIEGQPALVIGYGNIGAQIAALLTQRRMRVAVHDADLLHLIDAHENGYVTARDLRTLLSGHEPLLVFGATGRTSMSKREFEALGRHAFLASVSSGDIEFDLPALEALAVQDAATRPALPTSSRTHTLPAGVEVTVLADGRPVNFHETDSISNLHSDLVYAGMLTGACAVATDPAPAGLDPAWADTVLEESGLLQDYYERYGPPAAPTGTATSSARRRSGRGSGERR
ncbi:hypothetical protein ACIP88_24145 [Streptomyces uncialis]|uniref:hypothetical protein n=1 Tax=Streptomyces uncialis TaxID=1048205 RepID=UPI0037F97110